MLQEITLGGRTVTYDLLRKNVKNINLRIRRDGYITLSAHPSVPRHVLDEFLYARADVILRALDRMAEQQKNAPPKPSYANGQTLLLLGRERTLCLHAGRAKPVEDDGKSLHVTLPDPAQSEKVCRVVEEYMILQCRNEIIRLCGEVFHHFDKYGLDFPTLRFRRMRSRWGSCQVSGKVLTFNDLLYPFPPLVLEYVVFHEFVHFLVPNHSKQFYAVLGSFLPDWQERRALLRAQN